MLFSSKRLPIKKEKVEKYNFPVLTQHPFADDNAATKFELNTAAMEGLGFSINTPNQKINWGYDVSTNPHQILLANTNGEVEDKIFNLTANNTFSSLTLMEKLRKTFNIIPLQRNEFKLDITKDENNITVAQISLITTQSLPIDVEIAEVEEISEDAEEAIEENFDEYIANKQASEDEQPIVIGMF